MADGPGMSRKVNRRQLVLGGTALGVATAGATLLVGAGQWHRVISLPAPPRIYRLGVLQANPDRHGRLSVLFDSLRELGYVEDQNLRVEFRSSEFINERLPMLAAELVRMNVDVIAAPGASAHTAAAQATSAIPVVAFVGDLVRDGLAASYARPGGNVTGVGTVEHLHGPKRLELMKELAPGAKRLAVIWNPTNRAKADEFRQLLGAAAQLGFEVESIEVSRPQGLAEAFEIANNIGAEALAVLGDTMMYSHAAQIAALAVQVGLPAVYEHRDFVVAGGLISYGQQLDTNYRRAAWYVDRIFRGAKPADLPIEQPMRFDVAVNLDTVRALGLTLPNSVVVQVTEWIQ